MKLDLQKDSYDQEFGWVAHPDGGRYNDPVTDKLVERRGDIEILGGIADDEACYSYDEWALCLLDGEYYLLSTSGCSCPSPSETWRIEKGPATLDEIRKHVLDGEYDGYTLPVKQQKDFIAVLDKATKEAKNGSK